jgi:hypothetical protein
VTALIFFGGAGVAAGFAVDLLQSENRKPESKAAEDPFESMGSACCRLLGVDADFPKSNILTKAL